MRHISKEEFEAKLEYILESPKEAGALKMIVIRPVSNERKILNSVELTVAGGAKGDSWASGTWMTLPNGSPDPVVQIAVMNYRVLEVIADSENQRSLAGDALCVDLDLSEENLKVGDRLKLGEAELEVTPQPHTGCSKFKERFGLDALAFISSPQGKALRLRGVYMRVVKNGFVKAGDRIEKMRTQ